MSQFFTVVFFASEFFNNMELMEAQNADIHSVESIVGTETNFYKVCYSAPEMCKLQGVVIS